MKLAGDGFERRLRRYALGKLLQTAALDGIDPGAMLLSGLVACLAGLAQGHDHLRRPGVRITPQRQPLLLAVEVVLPEPALRSGGRDLEIEAALIGDAK